MSLHLQLPVAFLEAKQQKLALDHSSGTFVGCAPGVSRGRCEWGMRTGRAPLRAERQESHTQAGGVPCCFPNT